MSTPPAPHTPADRLRQALSDHPDAARRLSAAIENAAASATDDPAAVWPAAAAALEPDWPIDIHRAAHAAVFAEWNANEHGPAPVWFPDADARTRSNAAHLAAERGLSDWAALHRWSITDRAAFWSAMIERLAIVFDRPPDAVCENLAAVTEPRWLPAARMNIAASCFTGDRVTAVRPALRVGRTDGSITDWSLAELDDRSARIAAGLLRLGVAHASPVAIAMPMTAESVAIYLGIVRAGLCVVSIADSFAPSEIAARLRIAGCSLVFTQDVARRNGRTLPMFAKVAEAGAARCVVVRSGDKLAVDLRPDDLSLDDLIAGVDASEGRRFVPADPSDPVNILFSSGTTGDPKAIVWSHTTPLRCAVDGHIHLDIRPGDTVAWPTNLGWMMGPWLIFAALMNRATIALYEGPPTGAGFARFVRDAAVTMLGVVPSIVKTWRTTDALRAIEWPALRCFGSTGECSNADDYFWLSSRARYRPVIEYCGGTEIGGAYITGSPLQPQSPATFTTPALGLDFVILEPPEADQPPQPADAGEAYLIGPSIGLSNRLLNRDHHETYFADCPHDAAGRVLRRHGDRIERLPGGFYRAEGRADDTMNLGGIKVSSAEIERVVVAAVGVREAAAVAVTPIGGGPSELIVFYVPDAAEPSVSADAVLAEMRKLIRAGLNPLFRLSRVVPVDALPRTASNKVMRRTLRDRLKA